LWPGLAYSAPQAQLAGCGRGRDRRGRREREGKERREKMGKGIGL